MKKMITYDGIKQWFLILVYLHKCFGYNMFRRISLLHWPNNILLEPQTIGYLTDQYLIKTQL